MRERLLLLILMSVLLAILTAMSVWFPQISSVVLVFALMVGYTLLLTAGMLYRKRKSLARNQASSSEPPPQEGPLPPISILIPAHNEASVITQTLGQLVTNAYWVNEKPHFEVIVINDRSTDGTAEHLDQLAKTMKGFPLKILHRPMDARPGKSAVLNDGLALAQYDVIAVFDADALIAQDFLTRIVSYLQDPKVGAVQARKIMTNYGASLLTMCQHHEYEMDAHFQAGRDAVRGAVELRGNGFLIKREALNAVNGWTEHSLTDDLDLSTKLQLAGWDIRFAPKVTVGEEAIVDFLPLVRQRRRWAEGSLRRYLEYGGDLFGAIFSAAWERDLAPLRAVADMIAYFVQFMVPLWLMADWIFLFVMLLLYGEVNPGHWLTTFLIVPLMSLFFTISQFVAIVRFSNTPWFTSLGLAILTGIYMPIVWLPVVHWVTFKVLLTPRQMDWGKTDHAGDSLPATSHLSFQET